MFQQPGGGLVWFRTGSFRLLLIFGVAITAGLSLPQVLADNTWQDPRISPAGDGLGAMGRLAGADATPALATGERIAIGKAERAITGADEARLHRQTRQLIQEDASENGGPLVVVTHHAPHPLCLPKTHRSGWAAGSAASDLSALTDCGRIALWVHGACALEHGPAKCDQPPDKHALQNKELERDATISTIRPNRIPL